MVRREEQPWQSRCTVLLDCRATAHRGEGPHSSFEWAVSAAASVGVHLVRHGYHVRLVTETGAEVASPAHDPSGVGSDLEGTLLDALAVLGTSRQETFRDAGSVLRRGAGDGLLIAVLGSVQPEEARQLGRLGHGSSASVAVLLDTATWSPGPEVAQARARTAYEGSAGLLRASGWRVLRAGAGDDLAALWPAAARNRRGATLAGAGAEGAR
jgi:uncharacterized protein (DUF58 family)